jgi:RNA polymerase sigma-70 factor (ECF subfamily)
MARFDTTRWSIVLQARGATADARAALETLCRTYRPPVLAFIRSRGYRDDVAEDLTQAFFTRFLERDYHASADPARGRFRAFLLTSIQHFLTNAALEANAVKRGGRVHFESIDAHALDANLLPVEEMTPERAFQEAWAVVVLKTAMRRMRDEARAAGKTALFDALRVFLGAGADDAGYARVATAMGLRRNTVAVTVHRMRQRLRELVRAELAHTAAGEDDLRTELRELRDALDSALH